MKRGIILKFELLERIKFPYDDIGGYVDANLLINHEGKKFAKKRASIRHFEESFPRWQYEEIVGSNIDLAFDTEKRWQGVNLVTDDEKQFILSVFRRLHDNNEQNLFGGILTDGKNSLGYSVTAQLDDVTAVILIMRAVKEVSGLNSVLYRETARALTQQVPQLERIYLGVGGSSVDIQNRNSYL